MGRGAYRGRPQNRGNNSEHMMVDQDPNQRIQQHSTYQQDTPSFRGGRAGRGGNNDRGRGLQFRGRGRGNLKHDGNWNESSHYTPNNLVKIVVKGILESGVANEQDSGLATCRNWLEERANYGYRKPIEYVYLKSVS